MVTLRIPAPKPGLLANLLGLFGLLGLSVAVGGLTHNWWWSLAVGSVAAVFLSVVATMNREDETAETPELPADLPRRRPA